MAVLLALVLALTGYEAAVARAAPAPAGQMVICTGQGLAVIAVDAEGNPVGPAHICPDAASGFFAALAESPVITPRVFAWQPVAARSGQRHRAGRVPPAGTARGPPLDV
ncbi:hypothetical protein Salmuc_02800 [Salipiger mucosus DSM 16094]|uniref:Uncharacterized protein n=1 Tax=Salipiger mucosus DSM 16094 TaxID=1123237 RepID=S9SGK0_9RHOB|nr:hypothetical protein Salmuc_02800 [Salipiger mucosus DSM 16094]